jgi:peptide-methionine (R)-S-oxide reductase
MHAAINPSRRSFLFSSAAIAGLAGAGVLARFAGSARADTIIGKPGMVTLQRFTDLGKSIGIQTVPKVVKTEEEWKKALPSNLAFVVARQEGTEQAFTGPYLDNHAPGLYRCVGCQNALFSADNKYNSGTGWPSFWQPIARENVVEEKDETFGMTRTKVSCAECDAHLGHVFDDGPQPTGLRYCMNGVALRFIAKPTV